MPAPAPFLSPPADQIGFELLVERGLFLDHGLRLPVAHLPCLQYKRGDPAEVEGIADTVIKTVESLRAMAAPM